MHCRVPSVGSVSVDLADVQHPVSVEKNENMTQFVGELSETVLRVLTWLVSQRPCCLPAKTNNLIISPKQHQTP